MIRNYNDFCEKLLKAGFSVSSSRNDEGIFSLLKQNFDEYPLDNPIRWHTGDPETDPWEWRIRLLNERDDVAYAKIFFRKGGYITKDWYPYFLVMRRGGKSFDNIYTDGIYSHHTKKVYDILSQNPALPVHEIRSLCGFVKKDNTKFEKALIDLQMGFFITISGRQQKRNKTGEEYGWSSTVFSVIENLCPSDVFEKAAKLTVMEAEEAITEQVYQLNPKADSKKIKKFIFGR